MFKKHVAFGISGRKSVKAGLVFSNAIESRKIVGRSWVLIQGEVYFCLCLRASDEHNPNRIVFDTTLRVCGTSVRVLMPLLCLAHYVRFGSVLG